MGANLPCILIWRIFVDNRIWKYQIDSSSFKKDDYTIEARYLEECKRISDINEHLPVLYRYATECESIIECGVRKCVSTWALVLGLLNNDKEKKKILLNDIEECNIYDLKNRSKNLPVEINYEWKNNLDINLTENYDMIFIDTWHVYGHLKRELAKFPTFINKYIIMHDTTVDEIYGETLRMGYDGNKQSELFNMPIEEIHCGLGKAITEFLENNDEWELKEKLTNNNGLTILKRKNSN